PQPMISLSRLLGTHEVSSWIGVLIFMLMVVPMTFFSGKLLDYTLENAATLWGMLHPLIKIDKPLRMLKAFRFFLPRAAREDLDFIIADLEEDLVEMKQKKYSSFYIFTVQMWHLVRTVAAYLLDGARSKLAKLRPFLHLFTRG
ncbi:MAG: hypothetical protein Q8M07_30175, partial [Prosthecobacter sp.]|nr:hypothetical protein [Prosthecobacter sp.]